MGVRTSFPNINYVFGFLHQDWSDFYNWNGNAPRYESVIRFFKKVDSPERLSKAIVELKELIKLGESFDDDDEWDEYFWSDSSLGYHPPGGNQTYKDWLDDVLRILEEPIEENEKHFIPEFIG